MYISFYDFTLQDCYKITLINSRTKKNFTKSIMNYVWIVHEVAKNAQNLLFPLSKTCLTTLQWIHRKTLIRDRADNVLYHVINAQLCQSCQKSKTVNFKQVVLQNSTKRLRYSCLWGVPEDLALVLAEDLLLLSNLLDTVLLGALSLSCQLLFSYKPNSVCNLWTSDYIHCYALFVNGQFSYSHSVQWCMN